MALTNIQREVCRLIARQRIASGESYIAGGAALNTILHAPRVSQDLDLFHDTAAALAATWNADRAALLGDGYDIQIVRERPTFVEAIVRRKAEPVILQWLFRGDGAALRETLSRGEIRFHAGTIRGALPQII